MRRPILRIGGRRSGGFAWQESSGGLGVAHDSNYCSVALNAETVYGDII